MHGGRGFEGEYHIFRARKGGPNDRRGYFYLEDYTNQESPALDCVVRETCRYTATDFWRELHVDDTPTATSALPTQIFPAVKSIIKLGRKNLQVE